MAKTSNVLVDKEIEKKWGDILINASALQEVEGRVIPTTLSVDIGLGGGIPEGTVTVVGGVSLSGKSTFLLKVLANCQAMGKQCFFIDAEMRLRSQLLACIAGLDTSKLTIIRSTKEKFLTAEAVLNIIEHLLKEYPGCAIVLDSVAALCPEAQYGKDLGESVRMTSLPTVMYAFFRKVQPILEPTKANVFLITHMQSNPGGYGAALRDVGGNAQMFFGSVKLICTSSSEVENTDKQKIGRVSKFRVMKSALAAPSEECEFYIRYGRGYDREEDLARQAEKFGLLIKGGSWYQFEVPDWKGEIPKLQGGEKVNEWLRSDHKFADHLEKTIKNLVFGPKK